LNQLKRRSRLVEVVLGIACIMVIVAVLFPVTGGSYPSQTALCMSRVKMMALGAVLNMGENDDILPFASSWMDRIVPDGTPEAVFHDKKAVAQGRYGYAFSDSASGLKKSKVAEPKDFPLTFETILPGRNAHGALSSMPPVGRHGTSDKVGYLDTHVKRILVSGH